MFVIQFSGLNDLRDFMRAFAFCLMVPTFEKVTKKKAENNLFQFCFTLCKCFNFVICRHFTTIKWLKVLKCSKICLKMVKAMTQKKKKKKKLIGIFCFSMNRYHSIYTVDLTSVVSNY